MSADTWDPDRYHRFRAQRARPFRDLLALARPCPGGRLLDLGCGSGELTAEAAEALGAAETIGLDASPAMLDTASAVGAPGVRFELGDLARPEAPGPWDVVLANGSLPIAPSALAGVQAAAETVPICARCETSAKSAARSVPSVS